MSTRGSSIDTLPSSGGGGVGGGGGGGSNTIIVEDEGIVVDAATTTLDFQGAGVTAVSGGAGLVDVVIPGPTALGMWAGTVLAAGFAGTPLSASVVFGTPHPSGANYSVDADEVVVAGSGLSVDISIENKTAAGFDIVLNTAGPLPNLIEVTWQVQPHGVAAGPTGIISLPGIINTLIVDKGSNVTQDGSQQFPYHTIQGALAVAVSGDLILVYPGTYIEQITPVDGVVVRGVDQAQCILQNPGNNPGDAPIATAGSADMLFENLTIQATVAGGVIHQLGVGQETAFKDCLMSGQLDVANNQAILTMERNAHLTGQILVSGGDNATRVNLLDAFVTATATFGNAVVLSDADPIVTVKRSELRGNGQNGAVRWTAANDNFRAAWSTIMNGDSTSNPFERSAAQTPTYKSHHCAFGSDPESGGIWTNAVPIGQRFDTLSSVADF